MPEWGGRWALCAVLARIADRWGALQMNVANMQDGCTAIAVLQPREIPINAYLTVVTIVVTKLEVKARLDSGEA